MAKVMPKVKGHKKVERVEKEFKEGKLHSGSKMGPLVTNPKQATAIALAEQRKADKGEFHTKHITHKEHKEKHKMKKHKDCPHCK